MKYQSSTHRPKAVVRLGAVLAAVSVPILVQPVHAQVALKGAGATFPYPIYTKWFEAYQKVSGVSVNYQAVGSGAGIKQLQAGTVDFGASDAPLSDKDEATMPSHVIELPTVAGAVAVSYNLSGVSKLNLSGDVLADIYLGAIKTWNDPRIVAENKGAKLPSLPIVSAHRSDGSGTTFIFTNYLKAVSSTWAGQVGAGKSVDWPGGVGGKGNDGVAAAVKATEGGIGYVELAYAHHNHLAVAAIANTSGKYVLPSVAGAEAAEAAGAPATAKDARSLIVNGSGRSVYPITGYTFLLFYADSTSTPNGKAFTGFLKWAFTTGQTFAADLDYAPLPKAVVKTNLSRLP